VVRLGCLIALVVTLAASLASGAWADADPASDVLYVRDVFLPYEPVSQAVAHDLREAVKSTHADGKPIKVAVIASRRDLGGVPSLFGNPLYYARFLGAELEFLYSGRLLVVMPQGAALSQRGRLIADSRVLHAKVEPGADGLVRTATSLVRQLSGTEQGGREQGGGEIFTSVASERGSFPWLWVAIGAGIAALTALGFALVRVRGRSAG
jgi:hypothetical protein